MLGVFLQAGTFSFGQLLDQLETLGFFQYILPFLLIFAVAYAVLTKIPVFENNKGAALIVAIAAGLLSLQFGVVPEFFQTVFPRFGIALSLLLIALVLAGVFITDEETKYKWIFFGLGAVMFVIILLVSFSDWQFVGSYWFNQYGSLTILMVIVIAAVIAVIATSNKSGGGSK